MTLKYRKHGVTTHTIKAYISTADGTLCCGMPGNITSKSAIKEPRFQSETLHLSEGMTLKYRRYGVTSQVITAYISTEDGTSKLYKYNLKRPEDGIIQKHIF